MSGPIPVKSSCWRSLVFHWLHAAASPGAQTDPFSLSVKSVVSFKSKRNHTWLSGDCHTCIETSTFKSSFSYKKKSQPTDFTQIVQLHYKWKSEICWTCQQNNIRYIHSIYKSSIMTKKTIISWLTRPSVKTKHIYQNERIILLE